ncbi:DUF3017 domain-containing protein [Propionibacteriaceae bacterium G1746]|uniref:DUF3017 domain-containing protein n=1 Tax=Aestuariimicrobium sp. G57 TaxID=3418485 RepID=UPI003C159540
MSDLAPLDVPEPAPSRAPRRGGLGLWVGRLRNQWPLLLVLVAMGASCVVMATGHWRRGAFAFGSAVVLAGLLRMVLPSRRAGLLALRARWFDTVLLLVAGAALLALTLVVPPSPPPSAQ